MKKKIKFIFSFVIIILLCFKNIYANELNILKKGEETAKVTIKIFSSLTCPYCADFHLSILKNSVPEFIIGNIDLMEKIKKITYEDIENLNKGSFEIYLKSKK